MCAAAIRYTYVCVCGSEDCFDVFEGKHSSLACAHRAGEKTEDEREREREREEEEEL